MKVIIYGRVSTTKQANEGVSLAAQDDILYNYATEQLKYAKEDILILKDEGISGGSIAKRPAVQQVIQHIEKNKRAKTLEYVLIYNIRRLARNTIELLTIAELARANKVKIYSIAEGIDIAEENNEMASTIHAMIAQKERKDGAKTIKFALKYKKDNLMVYGNVPYGFKRKRDRLIPNEEEKAAVVRIFALLSTMGVRGVAREMNNSEFKPRKGKEWHPTSIAKIAENKEYYQKHLI